MSISNAIEELRTKEEIVNYFEKNGKSITEDEIEILKKRYKQLEETKSKLNLQQLNDVAGGVDFLALYLDRESPCWHLGKQITTRAHLSMIKGTERTPGVNIVFDMEGNKISVSKDEFEAVLRGENLDHLKLLVAGSEIPIEDSFVLSEAIRETYSYAASKLYSTPYRMKVENISNYGYVFFSDKTSAYPNPSSMLLCFRDTDLNHMPFSLKNAVLAAKKFYIDSLHWKPRNPFDAPTSKK